MQISSGIIPPKLTQEQVLKCAQCGAVFMGKRFPLPAKCPKCGSFHVKADKRVSY